MAPLAQPLAVASLAARPPSRQQGSTLYLDRRRDPRVAISGQAMAIFTSRIDGDANAGRLCPVQLIEASARGFAILSPHAAGVGEEFVHISDSRQFPRRTGVVAHCEPAEGGYRLGLDASKR